MHIRRLEAIGRDLAEVEAAIGAAMCPFAAQQALLVTIPGVDALTAAAIVAEIGVDMTVFGTAQRLAAWAELAKVPAAKPVQCQRKVAHVRPTTRAPPSKSVAAPARATPTSRPPWSPPRYAAREPRAHTYAALLHRSRDWQREPTGIGGQPALQPRMPCAVQSQRRPPPPHPQAEVQGHELAGSAAPQLARLRREPAPARQLDGLGDRRGNRGMDGRAAHNPGWTAYLLTAGDRSWRP